MHLTPFALKVQKFSPWSLGLTTHLVTFLLTNSNLELNFSQKFFDTFLKSYNFILEPKNPPFLVRT